MGRGRPSGTTILERGFRLSDKVELRREEVYNMLTGGYDPDSICIKLSEKYKVAQKSIQSDIYLIRYKLQDYMKKDLEEIIADHIAKYDRVYQKALERGDFDSSLKALNAKEKLLRIHKTESVVTINQLNVQAYTNEQLLSIQKTLESGNKISNE